MKVAGRIEYDGDGIRFLSSDGELIRTPLPTPPYAFTLRKLSSIPEKTARCVSEPTDLRFPLKPDQPLSVFRCSSPKHVRLARERIPRGYSFEADIRYVLRILYDRVLDVEYPGFAYVDIEVDDSRGFPSIKRAGDYGIAAVTIGAPGREPRFFYVGDYDSEEEMLRDSILYLKSLPATVVAGWNVDFDYRHLLARAKRLGLREAVWLGHVETVDMQSEYKFAVKGLTEYSLREVSRFEDGVPEKIEVEKRIHEMTRRELEEYNVRDVEILYHIEDRYGFVATQLELAQLVNVVLSELTPLTRGEALILRRVRELGFVAPNKGDYTNPGRKTGALVLRPKPGLHEYVANYDFASLYPNIIINENIDIPGFNGEVLPYLERQLLDKRAYYKRLCKQGDQSACIRQNAYKIMANSIFGLTGLEHFRYYDVEVFNRITGTGRRMIEKLKRYVTDIGYEVVYGDSVTGDTRIRVLFVDKLDLPEVMDIEEGLRHASYIGDIKIEDLFMYTDKIVGGKEYFYPDIPIYALAYDYRRCKVVWGRIRYVMKHKTNKRVYRVCTSNEACVKVTEDHSIIMRQNVLARRACRYGCSEYVEVTPIRIVREFSKKKPLGASLIIYSGKKSNREISDDAWLRPVHSVEEVEYDGYVYDIEVAGLHNYFANDILVHNTDSVFIILHQGGDEAQLIEFYINEVIAPYRVKLEEVYRKILFIADPETGEAKKKRYVALDSRGRLKVIGLEMRRSDRYPLLKEVQRRVIELIFEGRVDEVPSYLREVKRLLYSGAVDEKLVKCVMYQGGEYKVEAEHVKAYKLSSRLGYESRDGRICYVRGRLGPIPYDPETGRFLARGIPDYKRYWGQILRVAEQLYYSATGRRLKV